MTVTDRPPFDFDPAEPVRPARPAPKPIAITLPPAMVAQEWETYDHMNGPDEGVSPTEDCGAECGDPIMDGDPVRKVGGDWMHDACAAKAITSAEGNQAWLTLADMIAARPSAFRASDIRAVMSNVARIARAGGAS